MNELAPIVLFVYNRPEHTQKTLDFLSKNLLAEKSTLYIYCDGPKENCSDENLSKINQVRAMVKSVKCFGKVTIVEQIENRGLAESIICGVDEILEKHGKIIVLEDDIQTSKYFLQFMNEALTMYENEEKVLSIGACNFFANDASTPDTFFIPIPDCWGWATWRNRWKLFERDGKKLLQQLQEKDLMDKFNLFGAYNYEEMLMDQINGKNNSWSVRWQAVAYIHDKLSLYSRVPISYNFGFDHLGTHTHTVNAIFDTQRFMDQPVRLVKVEVREEKSVIEKMYKGYRKAYTPDSDSIFLRLWKKIFFR
ncbi:MAG: glycosyltransferase family 2 protein [Bacteroidetes bacterium]|nr:glycosyltransferase family 2 protein [Bacteroidota bacterium]